MIGPQEGLSISTLSVEQPSLKVTYMITTSALSFESLRTPYFDSIFKKFLFFYKSDLVPIRIWFIIDNSIKNHQNLINSLDFWNRRTLITMKFQFLVKFSSLMNHLSMKFTHIRIKIEKTFIKTCIIRSVFFVNFFQIR